VREGLGLLDTFYRPGRPASAAGGGAA
jgi:hypothetical protein